MRSPSPLVLYDAIVVIALFKHAVFNDDNDDRSNCVVEVIDDGQRIRPHRSHALQVRKPFRARSRLCRSPSQHRGEISLEAEQQENERWVGLKQPTR